MDNIKNNHIDESILYKERLTLALKAAKICVFEVDLSRQFYTFFENSIDIFGVSGEDILKDVQSFSQLNAQEYKLAVTNYFSHPDDEQIISQAFTNILNGQPASYQARMRAGGSKFVWCKIDAIPIIHNGKPVKMIGVITDISKLKHQNDFLREQTKIDTFTGLLNKEHGIKAIKKTLALQNKQSHALMMLDIDNFKYYNDNYGHLEGDLAIQALASLIKSSFRSTDICARFGGDEFMILIKNLNCTECLQQKINQILTFNSSQHSLTTSIGIAIYPQDATSFHRLFQKADKALYCSKKSKNKYTFACDILNDV